MAFLQPCNIVDHRVGSGLDAAVIAIDRFVPADRGILEFPGFLLSDENLDILAQGALIALQRENVIGLLLDDFRAMSRWQPIASIVTTAPSIAIMSSSAGMATISLDFSATLTWPSTRRWRAAKAETMWIAALAPFFWYDRREVLPSIAITSAGVPVSAATQATKQRWNCAASSVAKISPR